MKHRIQTTCIVLVVLLTMVSLSAWARIRPSFSLDWSAWEADQIVVVRVGETFEVLEVWRGDLTPGAMLEIPSIQILDPAKHEALLREDSANPSYREPGGGLYVSATWDKNGNKTSEHTLYLLKDLRAVLFLRNEGHRADRQRPDEKWEPIASLLPERTRRFTGLRAGSASPSEPLPAIVAWFYEDKAFALKQRMNPGPPMTWPVRDFQKELETGQRLDAVDEAYFKSLVERAFDQKKAFEAAAALENPEERLTAVRAFLEIAGPAHDRARRIVEDLSKDRERSANEVPK